MRHARHAVAAVAFADQILPRLQPLVLRQPVVDDARHVLDVVFGLIGGFERAAEPRADRIDEHEVRDVEPRARIVVERRRIRGTVALVAERDALRADGAEVQVHRRGAGTAVERKGHRTVRAFHRVGGADHLADLLAVGVVDGDRSNGRRIVQGPARELDRLRDMRVARKRRSVGFFRRCRRGGRRRGRRLLRRQRGRSQERNGKRQSKHFHSILN